MKYTPHSESGAGNTLSREDMIAHKNHLLWLSRVACRQARRALRQEEQTEQQKLAAELVAKFQREIDRHERDKKASESASAIYRRRMLNQSRMMAKGQP